ncbi:hypothetical protein IJ425_07420 [bacterium]|nr:hypothetical protein [bacterium]
MKRQIHILPLLNIIKTLTINIFRSFKYSMTNNISFKSRIVFTTPDKFEKIFNSRINESNFVGEPWNLSSIRTKSNYLGTSSINNCTGFSLNSEEPLLGHLMTSEENFNKLDKIKSYIENYIQTHKIKSALIIGSKSPNTPIADFSHLKGIVPDEYINNKLYDKNSFKLFQFIENIIKTLEPTIFKGHKCPNSNTSFIYDSPNDTIYVCTYLDTFKNVFVKNKEDLKNAFEKIKLSSKDNLEFWV